MQCINDDCVSTQTRVVESRPTAPIVYRKRKCFFCGWTFVTAEVISPDQKMPVDYRKARVSNEAQAQQ